MKREHLVSASVTYNEECICNPEVLLGTESGLWDFEKELAPKGTLLDLNAAWELFLSRNKFLDISFEVIEHHLHEIIDGVLYDNGDTTYTLLDDNGLKTGATFTIKSNKGPVEHIEWEKGKLYLYYTKYRPLKDSDLEAPIHYVTDNENNILQDEEGNPLIYEYAAIPIIEIFDNDETHSLFPWFADENDTVRLRTSIEGNSNSHLGRFAITNKSEVFIAKEPKQFDEIELVSLHSILELLKDDLGIEHNFEADRISDDGIAHNFRVSGSNLSDLLSDGFKNKLNVVEVSNENLERTKINTKLICNKEVNNELNWEELLLFADSIKNNAFTSIPNLLDALNWILTQEIGLFKETNLITNANTITEALNIIFTKAEENRDRIGYDRENKVWIELTTDEQLNLTKAINEVDLHKDALAELVGLTERYDPVLKKTYYSNPDLNNITKNRLRFSQIKKDDVKIVESINELLSLIGNLDSSKSNDNSSTLLRTNNKNTLVKAINEVDIHSYNNNVTIGAQYTTNNSGVKDSEISNLTTNNKSSIVSAINELDNRAGELEDLNTNDLNNLVSAINEIIKEQPLIYLNETDPDSGVILKDLGNVAGKKSLAIGDNNNIKNNSFASGSNNTTQDNYTTILGSNNSSRGLYSLINGQSNTVDGSYNLVNGKSNNTKGDNNIISGADNDINSLNSIFLGSRLIGNNVDNAIVLGKSITANNEGIALGKNSELNGGVSIGNSNITSEKSTLIGNNNESNGSSNILIGENNYTTGQSSTLLGDSNNVEGSNNLSYGDSNNIVGDNNTIIGSNTEIEGSDNILIGNNLNNTGNNTIIIGEINNVHNDSTHIGRDIYINTHNSESKLQELIFVNLNDWCKSNNAASLNGEKFLDTSHVVDALLTYLFREYTDNALLRFTMLDNENGYILIQGKSRRIYLNGTWYFSDNIENGWSRHDGEYLKVINKTIVESNGTTKVKHYLAFMDLLSTEPTIDTVGAQRSNSEDFKSIDLTHAYGAVDFDDIEEALDLNNKFNNKVDKYAKVITKYQDLQGVTTDKILNWIDLNNPLRSGDITLSLQESFGFNKFDYQSLAQKGKAGGYVPLNNNCKIDSDYLPSYIDDVIDVWAEYLIDSITGNLIDIHLYKLVDNASVKGEPIYEGEQGKIYVEAQPKAPGLPSYLFRYTGSKFVAIGGSISIGELEGTAFDGHRGVVLEENLEDHLKSGISSIPMLDEYGNQKIDLLGNPMWVTYKPNPHHVTAKQLSVVVNDPNDPSNLSLSDTYTVEYNVDSAIKKLFDRINNSEDHSGSLFNIMGSAEDIAKLDNLDDELGNEAPTLIGVVLDNKKKLDSIKTISSSNILSLFNE